MIAQLIRPAVSYVIFLCVFAEINSPKSQVCHSVGPCSGHWILQISEIYLDQGQTNKIIIRIIIIICICFWNEFPHQFLVHVIFVCVDSKQLKEARGTDGPIIGADGSVRGIDPRHPPTRGTDGPFNF